MRWLNHFVVIIVPFEKSIIRLWKQFSSDWPGIESQAVFLSRGYLRYLRENITSSGVIFASDSARTELTERLEQVHIIRANVVLRQFDNRLHERDFAVVIGRHFGNGTGKLCDFNFRLVLALEARPENFSLAGLETVRAARNGAEARFMRENDELFVDEIFVGDVVDLLAIVEGQLVFARLDSEMNDNYKSSLVCFTFAQLLPCTQ
jgi:hypothetical protein